MSPFVGFGFVRFVIASWALCCLLWLCVVLVLSFLVLLAIVQYVLVLKIVEFGVVCPGCLPVWSF